MGAAGHLVVLRDGDLAFLHVQPIGHDAEGSVAFGASFPSDGVYGLFLQVSVDGAVRTAVFSHLRDAHPPRGAGALSSEP